MDGNILRPICKILANITTGSEITAMFSELNLTCDLPEFDTKWKRLNNAVILSDRSSNSNNSLIKIIEYLMQPSAFIDKEDQFHEAKDKLNELLSFIGLELLPTGKIHTCPVATTLDQAKETANQLKNDLKKFNIHHQILAYCRPEIISQNLFHVVFEASKCVLNELRNLSGSTEDGNSLVNHCFDGKNPTIIMNTISSQDDWSEHKGVQALLNTIVYLYRNPKAHTPKYLSNDNYQQTLEALIIISKARYALDKCQRNLTK